MTSSQHGDATLTVEPHGGHMEVRIDVGTVHVIMTDREFRDVLRCARVEYVSMFMWPVPDPVRPHPSSEAETARRCQYCGHKLAQIFDVDGAWCSDEHQRFDRGNEETWWRKAVEG